MNLSFQEEFVLLNAHESPGLSLSLPHPHFSVITSSRVLHSPALCALYQSPGPAIPL